MAYRADIEIAVKGAQELKRLQDQVSATSKLVDGLNNYLRNIGDGGVVRSINNLNAAVADTAAAFNKAALGTEEATLAARNFVSANNNLTRGLTERLALLKSVTEQERLQRLGAAGIRETSGTTQLGPGPASPVGSLVGQKSPVAEKINQTLQARKDEIQLQAALLRLEEKSAAVLNEKLELQQRLNRAALAQGKTDVQTVSAQVAQRQQFLAGTSGTAIQGPLAGPGAMGFPVALSLSRVEQQALEVTAKKQEILQRMVNTRQTLVGLADNLRRIDQNAANQIKIAVADADRLNAAKLKQLQITEQIRASEGAASSAARQRLAQEATRRDRIRDAGFGIQGPALPPAKKGAGAGRSRLGGAISGSIIGGSFPLLFGQGAGAAAGGAVGGLVGGLAGPGGSFAGSLLGTLLGDIASQGSKVKDLAADIGFSAEQTERLKNAFALAGQEADKFEAATQNIRGLGLSIDDQADAITLAANLTQAYGGKIDKVAAAYANFVEKGKVGIADINKFTSEGIPILDELEKKYNTNRDGILKLAKDGEISAQALSDALIAVGNSSDTAVKKTVSGWDKAWADIKAGGSLLTQTVGAYFNALVGSAGSSTSSIAESFASMFKNIVQNSIDATAFLARNLANLARFAANISATAQLGGLNIGATVSKNIAKNIETTARNFDAALQKIALPEPGKVGAIAVPGQAPAMGSDGGRSKTDKAAEDAKREAARVAQVIRDQEFIAKQKGVETAFAKKIFDLEQAGNVVKVRQLQLAQELVLAGNETARLLEEEANSSARLAIARARQAEVEGIRVKGLQEVTKLQLEQEKNFETIIADLTLELKLKTATTEQERERLRIEAARAKLQAQFKGLPQPQIDQITALQAEVSAPLTDAQNIGQQIGKLKDEIADLTSISNIAITSAEGIGNAFAQSFQGLISGTMTAKEALGSFFKSVADMFLEMAAQIIAKQITMIILQTILKALGAAGGASSVGAGATNFGGAPGVSFNPGAFSMPALAANGATFSNGIAKFASGGIVSSPTMFKFADGGTMRTGLMGEAGPEAIMPLKRGADGSLGVQANGLREAMDKGRSGASNGVPVLNMSFQSTNINGVEYVSRDQLEQAMAQTRRDASRDGAQRGMTMTLDKLQQSPSTRSRVGMR